MHHPCRLFTFFRELRYPQTVPRLRPSGRRILYASRTWVLLLSIEITLTLVSEYISTASVFSVWSGKGAVTSECIHGGALPARATGADASTSAAARATSRATFNELLTRSCRSRLQNNLSFLAGPHYLKEVSKGRVVLDLQQEEVEGHLS